MWTDAAWMIAGMQKKKIRGHVDTHVASVGNKVENYPYTKASV